MKLKTSSEKREYLETILKQNNQADISIWIEDSFGCRDFLGRVEINLLDIFTKGEKTKISYMNKNMSTETIYEPKFYHNPKKQGVLAIDEKLDFSLSYDIWFYPEEFSNVEKLDLSFAKLNKNQLSHRKNFYEKLENLHSQIFFVNNYIKKRKAIENEYPMFYKERFFGFKNNSRSSFKRGSFILNNKIYNSNSNTEHFEDIIRGFYVKDQFGNTRILNSYLSKLTIETDFNDYASELIKILIDDEISNSNNKKNINEVDLRKNKKAQNNKFDLINDFYDDNKLKNIITDGNSLISKFKPGIGRNIRSYLHFVGCIRYSELDFNKENVLINSPDFVLKNRKGSVYEHAILLACLLINFYNKKNIEIISFKKEKEVLQKKNLINNTQRKNTHSDDISNYKNFNISESKIDAESSYRKDSNQSSLESPPNKSSPKRKIQGYNLLDETITSKIDSDSHKKSIEQKFEETKNGKQKREKNEMNNFEEFDQRNYYNYSRKELNILKQYGLQPPKIDEIEKKENIDGVRMNK